MFTKKFLVSAMMAAGMLGAVAAPLPGVATTAAAQGYGPPPASRYEAVPPARRGYIWSPGYHAYDGYRYVWTPGHYERVRPGYAYSAPRWAQQNGRWVYQPSRWDRDGDGIANAQDKTPDGRGPSWDRDNDGIPNRQDRSPSGAARDRDGDGVPNRYDADKDGDGVPNRYDNYPGNRNYR